MLNLTHNGAVLAGYTKHVTASAGSIELDILIKPDVDLDDSFTAFCLDENELIRVDGWNFTFEEVIS